MNSANSGRERRCLPRYPANLQLRWRTPGKNCRWQRAALLNLGEGGGFLQIRRLLPLHAIVEIELPFQAEALVVQARVQWISRARPQGVGLSFVALPEKTQARISAEIVSGRWLQAAAPAKRNASPQFFVTDFSSLLKPQGR